MVQEVGNISKDEVRKALMRMKNGKHLVLMTYCQVGMEVSGREGSGFLTKQSNMILDGKKMPEEWRNSVLVPIFKNKGDF